MSTNFYAMVPGLAEGFNDVTCFIHIGKRAAGWAFMLRVDHDIDELPVALMQLQRRQISSIHDLQDWIRFLQVREIQVCDEYDQVMHWTDFETMVLEWNYDPASNFIAAGGFDSRSGCSLHTSEFS